jgi:hypothetical protein
MTEEQWAKERATVIDEAPYEPRFGDGREELHPRDTTGREVVAPVLSRSNEQSKKRP